MKGGIIVMSYGLGEKERLITNNQETITKQITIFKIQIIKTKMARLRISCN